MGLVKLEDILGREIFSVLLPLRPDHDGGLSQGAAFFNGFLGSGEDHFSTAHDQSSRRELRLDFPMDEPVAVVELYWYTRKVHFS